MKQTTDHIDRLACYAGFAFSVLCLILFVIFYANDLVALALVLLASGVFVLQAVTRLWLEVRR